MRRCVNKNTTGSSLQIISWWCFTVILSNIRLQSTWDKESIWHKFTKGIMICGMSNYLKLWKQFACPVSLFDLWINVLVYWPGQSSAIHPHLSLLDIEYKYMYQYTQWHNLNLKSLPIIQHVPSAMLHALKNDKIGKTSLLSFSNEKQYLNKIRQKVDTLNEMQFPVNMKFSEGCF